MADDRGHSRLQNAAIALRARQVASRAWSRGWLLGVLAVWVSASGAHCPQILQQYTEPIPRALQPTATLAQVVDVVNDNSARVQAFSTMQAKIITPGLPSINANIVFQRPRSFSLVAQTALLGPEIDLGSNDELFWFWIKRAQPPALFSCRHDQFAASAARTIIPVEPEWLIEALGVVSFEKTAQIDGPFPVGNGRLEVRTRSMASGRPMLRVTIVDDSRGVVLEEHVYDSQGVRLASAVMSRHLRDFESGATLPRHIDIQWPPAKFEMSIDMNNMQINQLTDEQRALFVKPMKPGYNEIDLAQPNALAPPPSANGQQRAPASTRY